MRIKLLFLFVSVFLFSACSTVKRNGYYQTKRYKFKTNQDVSLKHSRHKDNSNSSVISVFFNNDLSDSLGNPKSKSPDPRRVMPVEMVELNQVQPKTMTGEQELFAMSLDPLAYTISNKDSCDNIILRDGSEISGIVIEIGVREIRYKKCDYPDGPTVVIEKKNVFMIQYSNGSKDVFKEEVAPETQPEPGYDDRKPSEKRADRLAEDDSKSTKSLGVILLVTGILILWFVSILIGAVIGIIGFILFLAGL